MNWKLIVAIVAGLASAALIYVWMQGVKNEQTAYLFMKLRPDVAVARGQAITEDMLDDPVELPESFGLLVNLALPAADAQLEWLKDRTASTDIPAGSVLLFQFFDDSNGGRLTTMITPGKRALTLPVGEAESVGGFVEPGSYIDVIGTINEPVAPAPPPTVPPAAAAPAAKPEAPAANAQTMPAPDSPLGQTLKDLMAAQTAAGAVTGGVETPEAYLDYQQAQQDFQAGIGRRTRVVTRTFLQNVRVLAVGNATTSRAVANSDQAYSHVTIEVTPAEAELLIFAMRQTDGLLNLVLRNPADTKVEELPSVNWTKM
ncbi:Flp pilus assembly protein CpaB [Chthonobacter albigriseus]|uniref:Flp pilus assembly protein CpaB n=1 Tax=Chthonobacter albigriseus TaxID=1683161 RepID=UPI0015EFC4F2|nr:RcpC/CpaB family pilus assembly protein [Chthonobacter albigriseus]